MSRLQKGETNESNNKIKQIREERKDFFKVPLRRRIQAVSRLCEEEAIDLMLRTKRRRRLNLGQT